MHRQRGTPNQRFHNSPRFGQQSVPHFTGPRSPHPYSPFPPPHYGQNPGNDSSFGSYDSPYYSPSPGHTSTPDPGRGRPRGRGHNGGSPRFSMNSPGRGDMNPGHSNNIQNYYHPSMMEDPWAHLGPVRSDGTADSSRPLLVHRFSTVKQAKQ